MKWDRENKMRPKESNETEGIKRNRRSETRPKEWNDTEAIPWVATKFQSHLLLIWIDFIQSHVISILCVYR